MRVRKKILWLVSWYPNKYDPFDGDFIQRHAQAAALYDDIHVLFIKQSECQKEEESERREKEGLTEHLIYLPKRKGSVGRIVNFQRWKTAYKSQIKVVIQQHKPDFIHVHVPWKAGLLALWAKEQYKIPFFVTEHWGIYNKVVEDHIYKRSPIFRSLLKRVYREAKGFISVSAFLGEGVNQTLFQTDYQIIPNVVDTNLFHFSSRKNERFTFIHVSNMVPLKNVEGLLRAFSAFLKKTKVQAQLILIGKHSDSLINLAKELGHLNETIFFKGEVPYRKVAEEVRLSHIFVLNSNIENSPCVIGEALCCGLPVIATRVGGVTELVSPQSGMLIEPGNIKLLAEAMEKMFFGYATYNSVGISKQAAEKFSYQQVGSQFHSSYQTK